MADGWRIKRWTNGVSELLSGSVKSGKALKLFFSTGRQNKHTIIVMIDLLGSGKVTHRALAQEISAP